MSGLISEYMSTIPPEVSKFVERSLKLATKIYDTMEEVGISREEFAKEMGISLDDADSMLAGLYNFTLKEIAKIEVILEKDII